MLTAMKNTSLKTLLIFLLCLLRIGLSAQKVSTVTFARYSDSVDLKMDIYQPPNAATSPRVCILFAFGGGFLAGSRDYKGYDEYFHFLADQGYLVASMDYRLGLKAAKKKPSLFNRKPLINAIEIAVDDMYAATNYLLRHAQELNLDTSKIIASGASSGAITSLQADYEKRNNLRNASALPASFEYAGVITFAGAIYSTKGQPDYKAAPAPMLLFHGDKDDVVPYRKISLFGTGIFGSQSIVSRLRKENHPYCFYTMRGIGHDAALFPMHDFLPEIHRFIQEYIQKGRPLYEDIAIKDDKRVNHPSNFSEAFGKK